MKSLRDAADHRVTIHKNPKIIIGCKLLSIVVVVVVVFALKCIFLFLCVFRVTRPIKFQSWRRRKGATKARHEFKSTSSLELFISCYNVSSCFEATIKENDRSPNPPKTRGENPQSRLIKGVFSCVISEQVLAQKKIIKFFVQNTINGVVTMF